MPGTTRYSATFDRTYEEEEDDEAPAEAPVNRRSRSQSWQAETLTESRRYRPLAGLQRARSPSADKGQTPKGPEAIPTRTTGKATVKAHNNPFQFVKVNTAPLHRKSEEQLKKLQEFKKQPVVKEDEEEWQSNLDGWKSRRRKMSETAIRRQEELRQLVMEDHSITQCSQQKKTKTFSEMVEQRAHRGRALSLCLFSNPLESNDWVFEANKSRSHRVRSQDPLSGESAESSTMNSEDDNDSYVKHEDDDDDEKNDFHIVNGNLKYPLLNGHHSNGIENSASSSSLSRASELSEFEASQGSAKSNGGYIDSGLESLSSSHRTGDIPDSGSDFSHDSGSSLDCDSPRMSGLITTGIELLEEFSCKEAEIFNGQNQKSPVKEPIAKPIENGTCPVAEKAGEVAKAKTKKVVKKGTKSSKAVVGPKSAQCDNEAKSTPLKVPSTNTAKSIESENEMYVDDFEELARLKNMNTKDKTEHTSGENKVIGTVNSDTVFVDPFATSSLNVIYQSGADKKAPTASVKMTKPTANPLTELNGDSFPLISEVPVDKITEEMERLILEQLEEEEKSKEMELGGNSESFVAADDKTDLEAPFKYTEPPKEKPPPPPSSSPPIAPQKDPLLKRVNSTKRIIKEIHRRRSDFLGIDKTAEENLRSETSVPPPPVLEDLLRAEREQDRLRRQMLASKTASQSSSEEDEIAKKEREIIENLETDEWLRQKQDPHSIPAAIQNEEERINKLKEERKQIEEERLIAEEQKARLEEARLLQQREEYIRKQEVDGKTALTVSALSSSSNDAPSTNSVTVLSTGEAGDNIIPRNGDGQNNKDSTCSLVADVSNTKGSPPATPPKPPLKKKEAIRKERERLRQEQETLQKEREEHRLKIQLEQEQLKKNAQNSHVPDAPVPPRVGPPTPAKPTQQSQLTPSSHISQGQLRDDSYKNSSSLGNRDQNGNKSMGVQGVPANRPSRNVVARTKAKVLQKVPCVRKQTEPLSESRYNQNHWLIQEAEMRRIAEQKERQCNNGPVDAQYISANQVSYHQQPFTEDCHPPVPRRPTNLPVAQTKNVNSSSYAVPAQLHSPDQPWTYPIQANGLSNYGIPPPPVQIMGKDMAAGIRSTDQNGQGPMKPTKGIALEKQEQMLSVSGRKRCSHCGEELGRGAAMIIESLQLYYHIHCFQCCVCQAQLGNGSCGTDVRVRNNKLHCHNCYSNDEAGLKFSQV